MIVERVNMSSSRYRSIRGEPERIAFVPFDRSSLFDHFSSGPDHAVEAVASLHCRNSAPGLRCYMVGQCRCGLLSMQCNDSSRVTLSGTNPAAIFRRLAPKRVSTRQRNGPAATTHLLFSRLHRDTRSPAWWAIDCRREGWGYAVASRIRLGPPPELGLRKVRNDLVPIWLCAFAGQRRSGGRLDWVG